MKKNLFAKIVKDVIYMREFYMRHKSRIDRFAFLALVTLAVYLFFTVLFVYLSPFFFGLIIAALMEPLVRWLAKVFKGKRWIASLVCLLVFLILISSLGAWLVTTLVRQVTSFVEYAPTHVENISEGLHDFNVRFQMLNDHLPDGIYIPEIQEVLLSVVSALFGEGMAGQGMRFAVGVPNFFLNMIVALISAYFFMTDREKIFGAITRVMPKWVTKQWSQTKKGLSRAVGGYFRAQYILMVMVFIVSVAGLLVLGNQYALLVSLLLAALDFLPIIGIGIVLAPWALISLIAGDYHQAIGLGVIWGVVTIARQVMQPKILGDQMGVHPLASLMSIIIGFRIFGLLGLIIGPSLLMVFIAIYETNTNSPEPEAIKQKEKILKDTEVDINVRNSTEKGEVYPDSGGEERD